MNLAVDQRTLQLRQVIATSKSNFHQAVNKFNIHKQLSKEITEYKESQQNELEAQQLLARVENQEHYPFSMIKDSAQLMDFLSQCKEVRELSKTQKKSTAAGMVANGSNVQQESFGEN